MPLRCSLCSIFSFLGILTLTYLLSEIKLTSKIFITNSTDYLIAVINVMYLGPFSILRFLLLFLTRSMVIPLVWNCRF